MLIYPSTTIDPGADIEKTITRQCDALPEIEKRQRVGADKPSSTPRDYITGVKKWQPIT